MNRLIQRRNRLRFLMSLALGAAWAVAAAAAPVVESDVCVYGGTSGGVAAAVAAARLGKSVVLVSLNHHVGGMSASGLGVTDIGPGNDTRYLGGIAREFYQRVGAAYGSTNLVIWFEPHVAENVFNQMLGEAGVPVYWDESLAGATLTSNRLTQITMADGTIFRAQEFIDTTYEGDLMAAAGVTFTWGREGTNVYNESLAGVRPPGGTYNYDPYVVPGNPASGLLPLVNTNVAAGFGQGDRRLQAYNYRLCLTQNPTNKIPIAPPPGYAEADYELVRRYVAARVAADGAVSLNQLLDLQTLIPNGKTDVNANGEISPTTWATITRGPQTPTRAGRRCGPRTRITCADCSTSSPRAPTSPSISTRRCSRGAWRRMNSRTTAAGPGRFTCARRAACSATT